MEGESIDGVVLLARASGLELGDEAEAVADRLAQLAGFARELDGLAADDLEIDATFDPSWEQPR